MNESTKLMSFLSKKSSIFLQVFSDIFIDVFSAYLKRNLLSKSVSLFSRFYDFQAHQMIPVKKKNKKNQGSLGLFTEEDKEKWLIGKMANQNLPLYRDKNDYLGKW